MQNKISWNQFSVIDMRVGTIIKVEYFEKLNNPAYILYIDFGMLGVKKSSAQITKLYTLKDLLHKQIIAIVNFPKKQIANIMSECLVLGVLGDSEDVILLSTERQVTNGSKIG